jgi:hypothetical protein
VFGSGSKVWRVGGGFSVFIARIPVDAFLASVLAFSPFLLPREPVRTIFPGLVLTHGNMRGRSSSCFNIWYRFLFYGSRIPIR